MEIPILKQHLSLLAVVQHYGHHPNRNHLIKCPFHEDKTASLQLYPKTNTWHCFGCGKGTDTIDFIKYKENCSTHEAINKAKELLNEQPTNNKLMEEITQQTPITQENRIKTLTTAFNHFSRSINTEAKKYLQRRVLNLEKLTVGYDANNFHTNKECTEKMKEFYLATGLLYPDKLGREGNYHSFFDGCIVFPILNEQGEIVNLYGRNIDDTKESKHRYLPGKHQGIYPKYPKPETEILIFTECIIDSATLLQVEEITNKYEIMSCYGTNNFTAEHQAAIKNLQALSEVILFYDGDKAGREAVQAHSKIIKEIKPNIKVSYIATPDEEDINSLAQGHESEIFTELINKRIQLNNESHFFLSQEKKEILQPGNGVPQENGISQSEKNQLDTKNPYKIIYRTETANYYIQGGIRKELDCLKITLVIEHPQTKVKSRNKVDLYEDKQIEKVCREVAEKLNLRKDFLEADSYRLTDLLEEYREKTMQSNHSDTDEEQKIYVLSATEKKEALQLASEKNLIELIRKNLTQSGIVGEEDSKVFLFCIAASHFQENPLNALIQGSSGSGKTRLLKQIFSCMPDESKKIYSRCSERMLFNVPRYYFKNKLVCFEDVDGLGEEAEYAWRELVSNGILISGVSYKDEQGNIGVKEITVCGPITSIACTTRGSIYADNMSRLFLIAIDESAEQTKKINDYQAKEASGFIHKHEQDRAIKKLQNLVRVLRPYEVHNPHAMKLRLPAGIRDERRLYRLYLYFIDMICVLHQHQREKNNRNQLVATKQDCQIAKELMFECIMLKMDELEGSIRQFFERLKEFIKTKNNDKYNFTQREIRESLQISKTHLFRFMMELTFLEYIQENKYNGNQGNTYQIKYWDDYKKVREDVKVFLQEQIDRLEDSAERLEKVGVGELDENGTK